MKRLAAWVLLLLFFKPALAASGTVLVLYPEASPPYRQAFEQMIAGIERSVGHPVRTLALPEGGDPTQAGHWIDTHRDDDTTLVLLGQRAAAFGEQYATGRRVLLGGINALPGQTPWPGVSLVIDPSLYLQTVHDLLPHIQRVIALYNVQDRPWIPLVKQAAAKVALSIELLAITDAESAIRQITEALKTLDPKTTAIWFTKNTIDLNSELIYPFVLEEAWQRKIAVFSDTVSHAKRGFLFALYPDYIGVGAELGECIQHAATRSGMGWTLTRAARFALNGRTARHLGIALREDLIQRASPLFPQP